MSVKHMAVALVLAGIALAAMANPAAGQADVDAQDVVATLVADAPGDEKVKEEMLRRLPAGTDVIPPGDVGAFRVKHGEPYGTMEVVDVQGMPFKKAMRLRTKEKPPMFKYFQVDARSLVELKLDEPMMITFWARAVEFQPGKDHATADFYFARTSPPYLGSLREGARLGKEWKKFYFPFTMLIKNKDKKGDLLSISAPGDQRLCFNPETDPQVIEIADVHVVRYPASVKLADLPMMRYTYPGREADAPWRKEAQERIAQYRMGDLRVEATGEDGKPVEGAEVHVQMKRHAFRFGCVASDYRLVGDRSRDGERYGKEFARLFNTAAMIAHRSTMQDAKKWKGVLSGLAWLKEHDIDVRAHCVVWGSWRKNPPAMREAFEKNPEGLRQEIRREMVARMTALKDLGAIYEWDAINEGYRSNDWTTMLGRQEMVEWIKLARQTDPNVKLVLNEGLGLGAADERFDWFCDAVKFLKDGGAPLDGLGLQAHQGKTIADPAEMVRRLDTLARFGLDIRLTEVDQRTLDEPLQADCLRDLLTVAFSHPSVSGFTFWGFWDSQHDFYNTYFYRKDWSLKPSGQAYKDLVFGRWWTDVKGASDKAGAYGVRGFLGDYAVIVSHGGRSWTFPVTLAKSGAVVKATLTTDYRQQYKEKSAAQAVRKAGASAELKRKIDAMIASGTAAADPPIAPVSAEKNVARVDLVADGLSLGDVRLTGGLAAVGEGGIFQMPVTPKEWKQGVIRFKPAADGKVTLMLRGPYIKEKGPDGKDQKVWVYFDAVSVEGAADKLAGGDFETADKNGRPADWTIKGGHDPAHVASEALAKSGKGLAKVWHRGAVSQTLSVTANQEVKITFWARAVHPVAE
jgi:GH35 family endo-1,4-beta-xylanase